MTTIWVWDISIIVQEMDAEYGMPGRASASSEAVPLELDRNERSVYPTNILP